MIPHVWKSWPWIQRKLVLFVSHLPHVLYNRQGEASDDLSVKALSNMHSLSDFRLRSFNIFPWIKDFEKILWSVYELEVLILKTNSWQQWRSISVTNSVLHWFSGSKLSSNHQESNRIADTCNTVRPLPPRPRKVFGRSQTTSECSIRPPSDLHVET